MRQSIRPVLVASRVFAEPRTVLAVFDDWASARKALGFVATSPLFAEASSHVVMVAR